MSKVLMRILGVVLIVVGIVGFGVKFTGLLNLTVAHDLIHLVTGAIVLGVSGNPKASVAVAKIFGFVYLVVGLLGLFVHNVLNLVILMPADTVIHFVLAIAFLYIGFNKASAQNQSATA